MWDSFVIVEECCPEKGGLSHFVAVGEPRVAVNGELGLKMMIMMAGWNRGPVRSSWNKYYTLILVILGAELCFSHFESFYILNQFCNNHWSSSLEKCGSANSIRQGPSL